MTTGSGDGRRPQEPTFADVMNGFSFDSGRTSSSRRWGRRKRRRDDPDDVELAPTAPNMALPPGGYDTGGRDDDEPGPDDDLDEYAADSGSTTVRPYAWTRGRTRSGFTLEIETLVSTSSRGRDQLGVLQYEHRSVAELCDHARSVAEVAALLSVPLGVAKVLVGDMAGMGLVVVHQTASGNGDVPDLSLMERVLSGLRRL